MRIEEFKPMPGGFPATPIDRAARKILWRPEQAGARKAPARVSQNTSRRIHMSSGAQILQKNRTTIEF